MFWLKKLRLTSFEIFVLCRNNFLPKMRIFSKIFDIPLHRSPQNLILIAFLFRNFPKIYKKVLKNFSRRLRRQKRVEISQFIQFFSKIPFIINRIFEKNCHWTNFEKKPIYSGIFDFLRYFKHNYAIKASTFTKLGDFSAGLYFRGATFFKIFLTLKIDLFGVILIYC